MFGNINEYNECIAMLFRFSHHCTSTARHRTDDAVGAAYCAHIRQHMVLVRHSNGRLLKLMLYATQQVPQGNVALADLDIDDVCHAARPLV
jgi:hypothetical protein